ncbi:hypothetical protein JVU11DRAFT_2635 [Chiua virens]|nr:hypothetical protein JVU11DRAFT_2635 [Chiua virens]
MIAYLSADKYPTPRNTDNASHPAAALVTTNPSTSAHGTNDIPTQASRRTSQQPGSQSSMHSLFSDSLEDEPTPSSRALILPIGRTDDTAREVASPVHVPRHDPEAWKEPSFIAKNKGKGKARATEELDTPSINAGKKRRLSAQSETPVEKRAKVASQEAETCPAVSGRTIGILDHGRQEDSGRSNLRKIPTDNGPWCSPTKTVKDHGTISALFIHTSLVSQASLLPLTKSAWAKACQCRS